MSRLGGSIDDDEVAHAFEQILDEATRVLSRFDDPLDGTVDTAAVAGGEGIDDVTEQGVRCVPQERDGSGVVDAVGTRTGD